jgi:hypothetical protein
MIYRSDCVPSIVFGRTGVSNRVFDEASPAAPCFVMKSCNGSCLVPRVRGHNFCSACAAVGPMHARPATLCHENHVCVNEKQGESSNASRTAYVSGTIGNDIRFERG